MTPARWERVKCAFESALESDAGSRERLVSENCGGDPELISEVTKLLHEHQNLGDFLDAPAVQWAGSLTPGTVIADRYELEVLLGAGGMGEVYRAHDRLLGEPIAIKILRADQVGDLGDLNSLQKEIQAARKVTHPNVCRVFDMGIHTFPGSSRAPLHFLSMELLEGETLQAHIARTGRLSGPEALPIVVQIAEGLDAAHAAGIIHRDLKSGNVILTPRGDGYRAVITDFGLARSARRVESDVTGSFSGQFLVGTVGYMSPEQLGGGPVTPASDIYSFGILLFEMVTGKLPFHESHIIQAAMQRVSGDVPSARRIVPALDARWERTIRKCLATRADARPPSAKAVANALLRPSWPIPTIAVTRRHWVAAACTVTFGVGLAAWYGSRQPYQPPTDAQRWLEQGITHVYETTFDAARRALGQALTIDPDYAPSHAYLAIALRELDYSELAREEILTALALVERKRHNSEDVLRVKAAQFFVSGNYDLAQPLVDDLARRAQGNSQQQAIMLQGVIAMYRNKMPDAQRIFEKVLAADSSYAGAHVRVATVYARQRKNALALRSFDEAENLFRAANDIDGVTEVLFQKGVFLARSNQSSEAIAILKKGLAIAGDTADTHHQVRLQLALGMAYGNVGQFGEAQKAAEQGIQKAVENRMEHAATVGLLDLGNGFLQRGQPQLADQYFQKGLEYARQSKGETLVMRATLSLGSLRIQAGRPREAVEFIQKAFPYFEQGNFLRERTQALILLGGAQNQLGQTGEAEQTLRKAVDAASQLGDAEQSGNAHVYLALTFLDKGNLPAALSEEEESLRLLGNVRGGLPSAYASMTVALINAKAGLYAKSLEALSNAEARLAKLDGRQTQLRAAILNVHGLIAYSQQRWAEASQFAHQALALPDNGADPDGRLLDGLTSMWLGNLDSGFRVANGAIEQYEQSERVLTAAAARLTLAQVLAEHQRQPAAQQLAKAALNAFERVGDWEAIWRCRRILRDPGAEEALERCRQILGSELFESYRRRPDLRTLFVTKT